MWLQKQFLLRSMIWLLPGAQGLLSASRGPVRAVHAWGGRCFFRTNWRQFMAVLWRVNLLPSRSLVNISTFFYLTMLQPALDIFLVSGVHQVLIPRDEVRQKQQGGISSRPSRLPFHFFLQEWPAVVHPTSKCVTWMNKLPGTKESWKMRTPWIFKTFGSLQILPKSTDD